MGGRSRVGAVRHEAHKGYAVSTFLIIISIETIIKLIVYKMIRIISNLGMNLESRQSKQRKSQKGFVAQTRPTTVWFRYGLPLLMLAVGAFVQQTLFLPFGIHTPLGFMALPIVISAIFFGFRPAMFVTLLGCLLLAYFLGVSWGHIDYPELIRLVIYLSGGTLVSLLGGQKIRSQTKLAQLAAATEKRKDEFLAMLGHELRNPLSGISAATGLLMNASIDQHRKTECLQIIKRQTAHMTVLINDLLDVSRVTRGQVEIEKVSVDLVRVMQSAVEQMSTLIENQQHRLILNLPVAPVWVLGDKTRLVQVVSNLLENAARYTPTSGILTLTLSTTQGQAQLSVQDSGIGITPEMIPVVFEVFTQAHRSTDGKKGGLGLGLALVKSMVEAHGGQVSVFSDVLSLGSTFSVTLTLAQPQPQPLAQPQPQPLAQPQSFSQPAAKNNSLDILLVEDNRDAAQTVAMMLEFKGHRVVIAYNGKEALEQAERQRFDGAILDIGLPDTDGYTLARRFREIPLQSGTRLVAVTGYGSREDKAKAYDAGFDQHITKPIADCDRLLAALQPTDQPVSPALS